MCTFNLSWKPIAALGATAIGIIVVVKMRPEAVERVSIHAIDAAKEYVITRKSDRKFL